MISSPWRYWCFCLIFFLMVSLAKRRYGIIKLRKRHTTRTFPLPLVTTNICISIVYVCVTAFIEDVRVRPSLNIVVTSAFSSSQIIYYKIPHIHITCKFSDLHFLIIKWTQFFLTDQFNNELSLLYERFL